MLNHSRAVLFDLDGTLLDTAPDLLFALNQIRLTRDLPTLSLSDARNLMSQGSRAIIKTLGVLENDPAFERIREQFLSLYEQHIADATHFFPGMEKVLTFVEQQNIPWGIVTNKLTRHTLPLLKALKLDHRAHCIICGDTLTTYKPDPAPIRYACQLIQYDPSHCLYLGDTKVDVLASKAAGVRSLVALYGYIDAHDNPYAWQADGYIKEPSELIEWLQQK